MGIRMAIYRTVRKSTKRRDIGRTLDSRCWGPVTDPVGLGEAGRYDRDPITHGARKRIRRRHPRHAPSSGPHTGPPCGVCARARARATVNE